MNTPTALRRLTLLAVLTATAACGAGAPSLAHPGSAEAVIPPSGPLAVGPDTVRIMGAGEATFARLGALIASARRSVHLEMYELGRPDLARALVDARGRGAAVTVIVDPSVAATTATAMGLRAAGVDTLDYPTHPRMIDHVKLLVVDSHVAVVGGINWGTTSPLNHDFDAELTGPAVTNLDRIFDGDLITCGRATTVPDPIPDPAVRVASTDPAPDIRPLALDLLDGARRTIDMEQFVLTDRGVVRSLVRAHRRGVDVRVLLDPGQRPSDRPAASLRAAGIEVRLYHGPGKLHAKAAVADGRTVLFGSANWTNSGFLHNHEVDIEIADSPAVAAVFEQHMAADLAAGAG